ncbi:hypothetical protein, partial [Thermococcus sp. M36]|uniref:hypothetical protein n=1 Tax=Thermococcus sp. M36 TaxID=1638261 RepID=UPI00197D7583
LNGQLAFNHFSPYGGIGFGNAMQGGRLHFAFDLGVLFDSNPTVNLQANGDVAAYRSNSATPFYTGPASGNRIVTTNVSMEGKNLQGDFKNYQIYPVIAFTIGYRFGI